MEDIRRVNSLVVLLIFIDFIIRKRCIILVCWIEEIHLLSHSPSFDVFPRIWMKELLSSFLFFPSCSRSTVLLFIWPWIALAPPRPLKYPRPAGPPLTNWPRPPVAPLLAGRPLWLVGPVGAPRVLLGPVKELPGVLAGTTIE